MDAEALVGRLRGTFERGVTKPVAWRLAQLAAMQQMLLEQAPRFEAALLQDLGKHPVESHATEVGFLVQELRHTRRHLREWLRPQRAGVPALALPARAATVLEPLGVALVIAPWNYPLMLALSPVIGAIAAGDAVIVKPSELAPATSALLAELLPRHLDARAVAVVEGGPTETTALLEQRFDTIFYTGNGRVGRIVLAAAVQHLTPVTLELGGKSPVYVDESADLDVAARRIAWGKYLNAGQTCVAPDYLLATPRVAERLVPRLAEAIRGLYGDDPLVSDSLGHIVDARHFERLRGLLADGRVAVGGRADPLLRRIEPTVLTGIDGSEPVMQQEIFGPILPVVEVADERAAIARVNAGDKPLSLYVFTNRPESRRAWTTGTSSGALAFDLPVLHLSVPGIPFGGVGDSGMGSYHGRRSLTAFSHEKAVFRKPGRPDTLGLLGAPYTAARERLIRRLVR
ncbi:MAG: aldehyde dehydrogenase family protein [Amnibacterium sp.]